MNEMGSLTGLNRDSSNSIYFGFKDKGEVRSIPNSRGEVSTANNNRPEMGAYSRYSSKDSDHSLNNDNKRIYNGKFFTKCPIHVMLYNT